MARTSCRSIPGAYETRGQRASARHGCAPDASTSTSTASWQTARRPTAARSATPSAYPSSSRSHRHPPEEAREPPSQGSTSALTAAARRASPSWASGAPQRRRSHSPRCSPAASTTTASRSPSPTTCRTRPTARASSMAGRGGSGFAPRCPSGSTRAATDSTLPGSQRGSPPTSVLPCPARSTSRGSSRQTTSGCETTRRWSRPAALPRARGPTSFSKTSPIGCATRPSSSLGCGGTSDARSRKAASRP